jgi:predicted MPP superfamily phosphohydrolase
VTRAQRFVLTCALFHGALVPLCVWAGRRWRGVGAQPLGRRTAAAIGGGALLLLAVVALAALCSLVGPRSGFTVIRLVAQALFAELLALAAYVAWTEWRRSPAPGLLAAALPAGLLGAYWEGYHRGPWKLELHTHVLDVRRGTDTGRLRIVHLSDLQTGHVGPHERRAVALAAAQRPDLVVWTGDYIHTGLRTTRAEATRDLQALLQSVPMGARLGSYAVPGDTDPGWPRMLANTGIVPLTDHSVLIRLEGGRTLRLVGLDTPTSRGHRQDLVDRVLASAGDADLTFVAGHNPDFVRLLPQTGRIGLALAGHTHGGQVAFPLLGAPYTKSVLPRRYARGLHDYGRVPLHVSAGIGMERGTAPQVRFLCPPEVCVIDVRY